MHALHVHKIHIVELIDAVFCLSVTKLYNIMLHHYHVHLCYNNNFLPTVQALKARGALKISLYVTHAVFPQESWKKFTDCKDVEFANFWITDSIPSAHLHGKGPFKVLSICDMIADSLLGYDLLNCNQ